MAYAARPAIGAKNFVYAVLTEASDVAGGTPTYGSVKSLAGLGKYTQNPNGNATVLYGDDQPLHVADGVGKIDLSFEFADIDPSAYAEILGHTYGAGGVLEKSTDQSPYVAIGFKKTHTGSSVETYYWLYKCKFIKPENSADTKKESISFQSVSLKAMAVPLISSGVWRLWMRTDDANAVAGTLTAFFSTVVLSASIDTGALTLTSGAGVASTKTVVLTFGKAGGGTTRIANAAGTNITAILDSDQSILTPVTFTAGTASVAPTVTIVYSTLTAAAHTFYVSAELKDLNGVACVAKALQITPSA